MSTSLTPESTPPERPAESSPESTPPAPRRTTPSRAGGVAARPGPAGRRRLRRLSCPARRVTRPGLRARLALYTTDALVSTRACGPPSAQCPVPWRRLGPACGRGRAGTRGDRREGLGAPRADHAMARGAG